MLEGGGISASGGVSGRSQKSFGLPGSKRTQYAVEIRQLPVADTLG